MPRVKRENPLAEVDSWNGAHDIGTAVVVTKDGGEELHTRTRSHAWVLGGHTAVVMVDGIAGGYLLSRVRPEVARG